MPTGNGFCSPHAPISRQFLPAKQELMHSSKLGNWLCSPPHPAINDKNAFMVDYIISAHGIMVHNHIAEAFAGRPKLNHAADDFGGRTKRVTAVLRHVITGSPLADFLT